MILLQKDQIDSYLEKTRSIIESANKELLDVKLIQQNDPSDYPYIMNQLMELDEEINDLLTDASADQRKQLEEAQEYIRDTKTIMIRGI